MREPVQMTKEIADRVFILSIEGQRISNEKFLVQKSLGLYNWDEVSLVAMKFLMEEKNVNA